MNIYTKIIIALIAVLAFPGINNTYSQLPNQNMVLLSNKNEHPPTGGSQYSAIWGYKAPNGREYAILGCATGTAFVDITDSLNIHEVDFQPGLTSSWREMKVYSHYAYIVSEATNSGLQIIDLQYLPDSVHFVRTYTFANYGKTHTISQSGPYLYMNGGDYLNGGVFILDLANPELPVKRGQWETYYVHDCRVVNDTIWACNIYNPPGTITIINATNKNNLQTVTSWVNNPNPFPHNIALTSNRAYAYTTDETQTPNGKLKVWNVQNLSNIQFVTNWQPTGITTAIVHNVEIYGSIAVIAHYTAGVRVLNITNPAAPAEFAWYDTYPSTNNNNYDGCWGVFMFPSGKIIASDRSTGLYVLRPNLSITGIRPSKNSPTKSSLEQNYPNPFNPSTTIKYFLPKNSHVSLKIYNVVGKEIASLVDGIEDAGEHSVNFDASELAGGVYFYTIYADGFTDTKRMTLIK
ncbi:MAG: choice-of-anchor B family protein [Ignavibacteriae bacterium]|nr:MAG: choice-of-anchor B family protein [Ignavibacteriota bacterium]